MPRGQLNATVAGGRGPRRRRLARRLLAAQGLVIVAGAVTLAVVAPLVGPALFHLHVERAVGVVTDDLARHLDEAFVTSLLLSVGIAVSASVVVALLVSWLLSSRLARPIEDLSATADRLAGGDLSARARRPPVQDELADLTAAFNDMAAALEHTEDTRQRLLSDLAHELRTPLATLEGYLEGLDDGVVDPDEATWQTLRDATSRLRRLVNDVGLVSRAEEGRLDLARETTDPRALVDAAVAAAGTAYRHSGVGLEVAVDAPLPEVDVDPARVQQILANLLDNALRHTPASGRVVVGAARVGGEVLIEVTDTGDGIDPAALEHVFERFYRADAARSHGGGSGIGLTIARAIARAHGGELTAHSAGAGQGASFRLRLPIAEGEGAAT